MRSRVCIPCANALLERMNGKEESHTVALIPQIEDALEPMSSEKAARLRSVRLQRTLFLVLRRLLLASHFGAKLTLPDRTTVIVSPLLLMYMCDYPEERSVTGLKNHGSDFDCTQCMSASDVSCTSAGLGHPNRPVLPTVDSQIKAATIVQTRGYTRSVRDLMKRFGIRASVPVLAASARLGSGPRQLYKAMAFDELRKC